MKKLVFFVMATSLPLQANTWSINDSIYPSIDSSVLSYSAEDKKVSTTNITVHVLYYPEERTSIVSFVMPNHLNYLCGRKPKKAFAADSYREVNAGTMVVEGQNIRAIAICNYEWRLDYDNRDKNGTTPYKGHWSIEFQPESSSGMNFVLNKMRNNANLAKDTVINFDYEKSPNGKVYFLRTAEAKEAFNFIDSKVNAI